MIDRYIFEFVWCLILFRIYEIQKRRPKSFYGKYLIFTNKEDYEYLITKIMNPKFTKKKIKKYVFNDSKLIHDLIAFTKDVIDKEMQEYPLKNWEKLKLTIKISFTL